MPSAPVRARSGRLNTPPICNRNPARAQSEAQKRERRTRAKNASSAPRSMGKQCSHQAKPGL
eukprot:7670583-Alexandrium_andersonii.AAC.1